jgi:hypothetical protein
MREFQKYNNKRETTQHMEEVPSDSVLKGHKEQDSLHRKNTLIIEVIKALVSRDQECLMTSLLPV